MPVTYASSANVDAAHDFHIKSRFKPRLWEDLQELKSNVTTKLSLITMPIENEHTSVTQCIVFPLNILGAHVLKILKP